MSGRVFNSTLGKEATNYINLRLKSMEIGETTEGCDKLLKLEAALDELFTKEIEALSDKKQQDNNNVEYGQVGEEPVTEQQPTKQEESSTESYVESNTELKTEESSCQATDSTEQTESKSLLDTIEEAVKKLID
jgi:hypothetical protein